MNITNLAKTSIVSIVSAICAYIFVFFFSNYASLFFAYDFDVPASFSLDGISFSTEANSHIWSRDALVTILLSKPISAFIGGIVFLFILMLRTKKAASVILFLFWLNVFAFNTAIGLLIEDAIIGAGTYEVAVVMNIDNIYLIIMSIISAFIMYKIGMMNGRLIMLSFSHQKLFLFKPRIIFFITIFLIPWLLVIMYTCLAAGSSFSLSELLITLPLIILLFPFLTINKAPPPEYKYLSAEQFTTTDLILSVFFIAISAGLIFAMKSGITISG